MKKDKIIYWIFTVIFFLFEGVMPALTSNTDVAKEGISHLGYPDYFRVLLTCFKVAGALVLILPMLKGRIKEWAYAGFTFSLISALVSDLAVDGVRDGQSYLPLIIMAILAISYIYYHKINRAQKIA